MPPGQVVCLWVALVLFVLAALVPAPPTRIGLVPAGLAFVVGAFLFSQT